MATCLQKKLGATEAIIAKFGIDADRAEILLEKVARGHAECGQDPGDIDDIGETVDELLDIIGYRALASMSRPLNVWDYELIRLALRGLDVLDELAEHEAKRDG